MLLGLKSKEEVLEDAKKTHKLRENILESYKEFLKLNNPALQAFIHTIFPTIALTNTFCYDTIKSSLQNGTYGEIFYTQVDPIPLTEEVEEIASQIREMITKNQH